MTSRQHRRRQWAEERGKELLRTIKETKFLQAVMLSLGTDDPLAQQIRQLGLDTWNLSDEGIPKWMERRNCLLEAARRRVC